MFYRELIIQLNDKPRTAERIAAVMASMFMKQDMTTQFQLPDQISLATALEITNSVVREIWHLLLKKYKIITTKRGVGTFWVYNLSVSQRKINAELIRQALLLDPKTVLDFPWLRSLGKKVDARINYALRLSGKLSNADLSMKVIPALLVQFAKFCSSLASYDFTSQEIYYCRSYTDMLTKAFVVWCAPRKNVAVMSPLSKDVEKALRRANRNLVVCETYSSDDLIYALEKYCQDGNVGLVYFGPTIPYPILVQLDAKFWVQVQHLQRIYGFIILIDNPVPHVLKIPDLLKGQESGSNGSVVIITKPSSHYLLSEINIIAGPRKGISKFRKKFCSNEPLASPALTYGLLYLLEEGNLQMHELEAYKLFNQLILAVKELLIGKDLFVEEYLENQQLWYYYLVPKSGRLNKNWFKKLNELNLFTCNPGQYGSPPGLAGGLIISIGFYTDLNQVLKIIGRLLNAIIPVKS